MEEILRELALCGRVRQTVLGPPITHPMCRTDNAFAVIAGVIHNHARLRAVATMERPIESRMRHSRTGPSFRAPGPLLSRTARLPAPDRDFSPAKKLGAIAAAAIVATLSVILAPGFASAVSARTPPTINASAAMPHWSREADDGGRRGEGCAQNWPYYARGCLRDERQPDGRARAVRLIPLDHLVAVASQQ
jgi:hypothetical protein